MTKQFKIGESALGGIIKVNVDRNKVVIDALDWTTKKSVPFTKQQFDKVEQMEMYDYLTQLTTHYYADKILNYIFSK